VGTDSFVEKGMQPALEHTPHSVADKVKQTYNGTC